MLSIRNYNSLLILPGAFLSGLFVYFILSYLLMPGRISLPISIITSALILGLTMYYNVPREENNFGESKVQKSEKDTFESKLHNIIFMIAYVALLAVLIHSSSIGTSEIFVDWEKIGSVQGLYLAAAIAFSFFLPGYALVTVLDKKYKLRLLLKLLLAYLFSMLITGLGGYASGSFGYAISNTTIYFIGSYILIFLFYLQQVNAFRKDFYTVTTYSLPLSKTWRTLLNNYSQVIVFSGLFALVILYSYYLNDGKIVVDQWYHHGRALLVGSGLFRDLGPSDITIPPFFPSLLAAYFNLSGTPTVNAYVAINFLNIMPVFAFYYFFTSWVPRDKQRAGILACTLFMLSSGFGWLYVINAAESVHSQETFDVSSSLEIISQAYRKTFDIQTPTTFIDVGHPDVTTALIVIALPVGFTLLGLIKEVNLYSLNNVNNNTSRRPELKYLGVLKYIAIITAISFLGILSHDEFYLFIIVGSSAIVVLFRLLPLNINYSIFFVSFLSAISLVVLVDIFISPAKFYLYRHILEILLIILCFLFVSISWSLYAIFRKYKTSNMFNNNRFKRRIKIIARQAIVKRIVHLNFLNDLQIRFLKFAFGMAIVLVVVYLYLFTLLVWEALSVNEISSQIKEFVNVPWYLFPMKYGLTGLLGLAFILSYLFKKFEKEIFIFGIIIIIAFFAGPHYDEHRFGKYIMAGMAAFAALLIYQIIASRRMKLNLKLRPLIVGILFGVVITSSCLSIFMYAGWVGLYTGKSEWIEGGRRDFPITSELRLLNFLNSKIIDSKAYNIAMPEKDTSNEIGFVTKIYGFSPTSRAKLLQSPLTLNSSTMEGLYDLLNQTDVRFIIFPKKDIIVDKEEEEGITSLSDHNYNSNISNVMRFVLDNFPKAYEDQDYIILEVLPLTPPDPESSIVSFVYQRDFADMLPHVSDNSTILPIDLDLYGSQIVENTKNDSSYYSSVAINYNNAENENLSSNYGLTPRDKVSKNNSKIITLWSHPIQQIQQRNAMNGSENNRTIINYIEGNFRIIDELLAQDKSEKKNADGFGAGIVWEFGNDTYLASISNVGLQLSQNSSKIKPLIKQPEQPNNTGYLKQVLTNSILSQNEEVKRQKGIWYNLKILFLKDNVEIYLNDVLRIKVPIKGYYDIPSDEKNITDTISRVGINSYYSKSEFQPIVIGQIPNVTDHSYPAYQKIYYQHYYPLSSLALSETKYDSYMDGDLSAFSKKYVVLPFDKEPYQKNEASKYLEYVNKGGNLIVINSNNKLDGIFARLFSIKPGNLTKYTGIEVNNSDRTSEKNNLTVSGVTRSIEIYPNSNLTIKSYYIDKPNGSNLSQIVAPFAMEKAYGKGKITYVNAIGYFDSIFGKNSLGNNTRTIKTPHFMTLSKVAPLMGIPNDISHVKKDTPQITLPPLPRIIGDIRISSGQNVIINGSSLVFPNSNNSSKTPPSYNLYADDVSISGGKSQQISLTNYRLINNDITSQIVGQDNSYYFKKALIKDLELFGGPFEIIINVTNSTRPIYLPTSLSYNDYIGISIPKGFDMIVKFLDRNSTYAQLDMMKKNDTNSFQRIKVSGYSNSSDDGNNSTGQILFHNMSGDIKDVRYILALMKSPEIKIISEDKSKEIGNPVDEQPNAIKYRKDSPESTTIEIQRGIGDITMNIDHVDNYNENYLDWTRTKFITYLKNDVQITDKDNNIIPQTKEQSLFAKLVSKTPGDISEFAKEHEIEVPWRDVLTSTPSIILSLVILAVAGSVITLAWFKIKKLNR